MEENIEKPDEKIKNDTIETISEETVEETALETAPEEKKNNFPTQAVLTIRAIVGGYVIYLAYQIITSGNEISAWMWAAIALFIVAGTGLVVTSVKHFICGEYEGGKCCKGEPSKTEDSLLHDERNRQ